MGCTSQLGGGIVGEDGKFGLGSIEEEGDDRDSDASSDTQADSSEDSADGDPSEDTGDDDPASSDSSGEPPSTSDSGDSGDPSDPSEETAPPEIEMKIRFRTATYGGNYGPRNVGAVWIETRGGSFIRTVKTWGRIRQKHLVRWIEASERDETDAITGATIRRHQAHDLTWDAKDNEGKLVEAGDYALHIEITEDNSSEGDPEGPTLEVPFTLGESSETLEPDDTDNFLDIELVTPAMSF